MAQDLSGHLTSLDQLRQLLESEGRAVGCFVPQWLLAKCRVKALAAILIKPGVFWLPQGHCFRATRRVLGKGCDDRIELTGSVGRDSFVCLMTEDEGISLTVSYSLS